jgi:formylmethanofuran dehydrogenase subunit A
MADDLLLIEGGKVYDPANGIAGVVKDLWVSGGKMVTAPSDPSVKPARRIDAKGFVVMPGGVDMHCHIAGPKVNTARKMRPEDRRDHEPVIKSRFIRSGTLGSTPSSFATGYKYAGLGYTTAFDAAVPPLAARHVHEEFADTPCIDKGFFALVGNNHFVMRSIKEGRRDALRNFLAWLLSAAKGYAPKIVNPGGVEIWKQKAAGNAKDIDTVVDHFDVTPRQILQEVTRAANELKLPHAVHIHCNNLGLPGNWHTTLETMKTLDGHRAHLTHVQFHSYAGGDADETTFGSKAAPLVDWVNSHPEITVDVGQVMFGKTTSMTGDGPLGYYLQQIFGTKWFSADCELEAGCGIAPIAYKNKNLVHAWQWAIGLEWFLTASDPWRIALSTDHPNGASFTAYPEIIRLLMDREHRREVLKLVNLTVAEQSILKSLDREYSLEEICIITRAAPARMLGLKTKGHLGAGADADVTIYDPDENWRAMFEAPRYVIKGGHVIVEDGELRMPVDGKTLHIAPGYDTVIEFELKEFFERYYSVQFDNYAVGAACVELAEVVSCGSGAA